LLHPNVDTMIATAMITPPKSGQHGVERGRRDAV
jgi:hypothetical protein